MSSVQEIGLVPNTGALSQVVAASTISAFGEY